MGVGRRDDGGPGEFEGLPTNVIQIESDEDTQVVQAPRGLTVDSGVLPMPQAPLGGGVTPPPEEFDIDIDVDPNLVEQLAAGLGTETEDEVPAITTGKHAVANAPYWEQQAQRLRAELALQSPNADRRRVASMQYELGRIYETRLGRAADALTAYQNAFTLDASFGPNLRALRRALIRRGHVRDAVRVLDAELAAAPQDSERAAILFERGRLRERLLEDLDGAGADYTATLRIDAQDGAVLMQLSDIALRRGEFARAVELHEHRVAGARDPALCAALLAEGATLCEDRLVDENAATDFYRRALELDPTSRPAARALARLYRRRGRWLDLVGVYEQSAIQAPTHAESAMWLHRAARVFRDRLRDEEKALTLLERAAGCFPKSDHGPRETSFAGATAAEAASQATLRAILVDLAGVYEEQRRFAELADALESASSLTGDPRQAAALSYRLGKICGGRLHDEERAIRALREAVALAPDHHPARRALGKLYFRRERWPDLVGLLAEEADLTHDPERKAARFWRIADLFERKLADLERAVEYYERALATLPGYAPAIKGLGRAYDALGRASDLVQVYERELAFTRDREEQGLTLLRIAQLWEEKLGEPMAAVSSYERLLALSPNHPIALRALVRLYGSGGRWRDLVDVLSREAEQLGDPSQVVPLLVRAGDVYESKLDDAERALRCYRQALSLKPDFLPALLALGRLAQRLGRWDDVIDMYRREIEVARDAVHSTVLQFKIGEILEEQLGRPDDAARAYLESLRHDPQFPPARDALARLHETRGNWTELALLTARGREPDGSRAKAAHWYRIGEIQEKYLSNPGAAAESYRRALKVRPTEHAARTALERLLAASGDRQGLIALYSGVIAQAEPGAQVEALAKLARLWRAEEHDLDHAAEALEQILALEPNNRFARQDLLRLLSRIDRWEQVVGALDAERQGAKDPRWAIACALDMAAIREHKLGDPRGAAEIYYQVLAKEPNHPQALAALEAHYRSTGNTAGLVQVLTRYAQLSASAVEAACYLLSVGAGHDACGARERALRAWHEGLEKVPTYLPALRALGRIYRDTGDVQAHALALEAEARASSSPDRRADLEFGAGELWRTKLDDIGRATAAYRRALEASPAHPGSIGALDALLSAREAWDELAGLLEHAVRQTEDTSAKRDLEIRLAELAKGRLHDSNRAANAYRRALSHDPRHRPTLAALAELSRAAGQYAEVAELDTRLVALTKGDNHALRLLHAELGQIFDDRMPDSRRALEHYQKALALDPLDLVTLDRISALLARERDFAAAEQATATLIARSPERAKKLRYTLRLASVYEGLGDLPRAAGACRDALALDPNDLDATERLAMVLARLKDWKALGSHLEGVLRTHRARISEAPAAPQSYQVLRKVFEWQKAYDRVFCAASALQVLRAARPEDEAFVRGNSAAAQVRIRSPLAESALEVHLLAPAERGSLREILRIGEESLERIYPQDLARHQVARAHKVTTKSSPRLHEMAQEIARGFGVNEYDLYVVPELPQPVWIENGSPPAILLSERHAQATTTRPAEVRFLLGYALGRIRSGLVAACKIPPEELGHFVAAMLALEVGSFVPPYPAALVEPLARRIQKLLPKKSLRDLGPYALEVAGKGFTPHAWRAAFEATAARAGLLVAGDLAVGIEIARVLDGAESLDKSPRALEALQFAVSEDHFVLRQQLGISISP